MRTAVSARKYCSAGCATAPSTRPPTTPRPISTSWPWNAWRPWGSRASDLDEDSRLGKEILLGGVRYGALDTPSDDATADFYELAVERLAALGIARYRSG